MLWLWIVIGLVVLIAIIFFSFYNRFQVLENRIDNSLSQIDVQLKRRADLIPNLVKTVKGYAKHEKEAIKEVTDARKEMMKSEGIGDKVKADDKLQSALKNLFAIAEGYPDLKANQNFLQLQNELTTTEDKIAYARQHYNDSVLTYNNLRETFPGNMFAGMFGKKQKKYLEITKSEKKKPEVNF
ncbi:MAG TPA: LemA family protein [Candidatus Nanoarchaeia archaeon]|nr:LemA family protein [Candidatus Nanoarchaeia archaeon]